MDILHQQRRATAHEVQARLADAPSYSAVRALLRLLEERGHIRHVQEGTRYVYQPVEGPTEARRKALTHVIATFFGGSVEQAIMTLIESPRSKLTAEELERIEQQIERAKEEGR